MLDGSDRLPASVGDGATTMMPHGRTGMYMSDRQQDPSLVAAITTPSVRPTKKGVSLSVAEDFEALSAGVYCAEVGDINLHAAAAKIATTARVATAIP